MTPSRTSDTFLPIDSLGELGQALFDHQALIEIDYLYDHGWQVAISNPGGRTYVHQYEGEAKGGPFDQEALYDTVTAAFAKAIAGGWL